MSSDQNEPQVSLPEEQIDVLVNNSRGISSNSKEIDWVFEDTFGSDRYHNDYSDYFATMRTTLLGIVEEGEEGDVAEALVNAVVNFDFDLYNGFRDKDEDLADTIRNLAKKYGLDIQRRVQHIQQGHDYWTNVKSDLTIRSSRPAFTHEFIIDYEDRVHFDSGLDATAILARHFLQQLADAPDSLGEDILAFLDESRIEEINEISGELLDRIEEYDSEEIGEPFAPESEDRVDTESNEE